MSLQRFDRLDPATEAALRESIRRWGVIVPVVRDQDGRLVDGHQRTRIARELGLAVPTREVEVANREEADALGVSLNIDRRHLTVEQRKEIAAGLRANGHSTRAIAGALGVSQTQVVRDLATGEPGGSPPPKKTTGRDGKQYPATRPRQPAPPSRRVPFNEETQTVCPTCQGTGRITLREERING